MQVPKDRKQLKRYLVAVNFLSKFIPFVNRSEVPLTNLIKKDHTWRWGDSVNATLSTT